MAVSIVKSEPRGGTNRLIAEHDLYLDETRQRVIVVQAGEEVPKDAAFVLAGKGGIIPPRYADMLKAIEGPPEPDVAGGPVLPSEPIGHIAKTEETETKPTAVEPSSEVNETLEPKAKSKK